MQNISDAKSIIKKLKDNAYEAYLVGGCVRDYLQGMSPKDFDITTSARPESVESIFHKTIPTGKEYGTISVIVNSEAYEVTSYRLESEYTDNRRPKAVRFSDNLIDDLMRRDFTINAIAMDTEDNIIDYFGGVNDLNNRLIRCVEDPNDRFREDALRKLRAIRFACEKKFDIESATFNSIKDNPSLAGVSAERIQDELTKILLSDKPSIGINLLLNSNLLKQILPELLACVDFDQNNKHHIHDVFDHICMTTDNVSSNITLRLAALLHDIGKTTVYTEDEEGIGHFIGHEKVSYDMAADILTRLKYPSKVKSDVKKLISFHMRRPLLSEKAIRRFISKIASEYIDMIMELFRADSISSSPSSYEESKVYLSELDNIIKRVIEDKQPISRKDLAINGRDILENYKLDNISGKDIGLILGELLSLVIDDPSLNNREALFKEIDKYIKNKI